MESRFLLPIEFTFFLVALSMCGRVTLARSLFSSFTYIVDSKKVLGVLGIRLTWRAFSSCIEPICVSTSYSLSSIMALSAFLFGQSRAQCGLSHKKHLVLGSNSFFSILPFPSLGVLPNLILEALCSPKLSLSYPWRGYPRLDSCWRSLSCYNPSKTSLLPWQWPSLEHLGALVLTRAILTGYPWSWTITLHPLYLES